MSDLQAAALLAGIPHAAILIDAGSIISVINPQAQELFGKSLEGRHYVTVLRQPILLECVEACLSRNKESRVRFVQSKSTHETVYEVVCRPVNLVPDAGILMSFQDVSPFEEAAQMRSDFVANVSHELRTPLTALAGFIETLRGPARDDSAARDRFLEIMEREAARMNRLVRDLLSLSRVESEKRIRPDLKVDLLTVLETAVVSLRPMAQAENVTIEQSLPENPVMMAGDRDQLQQLFCNLIENAIKYGKKNANVRVAIHLVQEDVRLRGPAVQIHIEDEGEGIDPLHIPRLTERFYRIDGHRSREMGGTGLGLAIVKHIVDRHRGRLQIESVLGQGSRFSILLPIS